MKPVEQRGARGGADELDGSVAAPEPGCEAAHGSEGAAASEAEPVGAQDTPAVVALPQILLRTSREITAVLHSLYRSHAFLEQSAVQRLHGTRQRLHDVTAATETATYELLEGLDRTLVLVEELGLPSHAEDAQRRSRLHHELRDGVYRLITALQFQDIVAQQIAFAVRVLEDTERRMTGVAELIESTVLGGDVEPFPDPDHSDHDPGATMGDVGRRQELADSIFGDAFQPAAADG